METNDGKIAKPFLKWAGGKTQLINEIEKKLPQNIINSDFTFIEPFVGSGAIFFHILNKYPNVKNVIINDINTDLINSYIIIKNNVKELIHILKKWEKEYYSISENQDLKKEYYYEKRTLFNKKESEQTIQAALFIFLNRTCFNGLYRVNSKNEFNVPIGSYKKPQICNAENLAAVSKALKKVKILNLDFSETINYADENTLFYIDPPYKPLSDTSSFNSYAKDVFDDNEQIRLAEFCHKLDIQGHNWILSNSDVKGKNSKDKFFDELYSDFKISRVMARRSINSNPDKRGKLAELLISNQKNKKKSFS